MFTSLLCCDCGKRKGLYAAIKHVDGLVSLVCQLCANKWKPFMHHDFMAHRLVSHDAEKGVTIWT